MLCTSAHASTDLGLLHMTHFWLKEQVIRLPHFHFFSFFTLVRSLAGHSLRPHLLPFLWIDVALCVSLCVCAFFVLHVESLSSSSYCGSSCVVFMVSQNLAKTLLKTQSSRNVTCPSNYALWNVTWMHLNAHLWRHPHPQLFKNTFKMFPSPILFVMFILKRGIPPNHSPSRFENEFHIVPYSGSESVCYSGPQSTHRTAWKDDGLSSGRPHFTPHEDCSRHIFQYLQVCAFEFVVRFAV